MKITLISPPWYNYEPVSAYSMNLGLAYIASYLRSKGHVIEVVDALYDGHDIITPVKMKYQDVYRLGLAYEAIADRISPDTDYIGISASFSNLKIIIRELTDIIKQKYPDKPIVIGGVYPSTSGLEALSEHVDYLIRGEGEIPLGRLLAGEDPVRIKGLIFRNKGQVVDNGRAEIFQNLDELPYPARDLFHYNDILDHQGNKRLRVETEIIESEARGVPVITSRGCPFDCTFCSIHFVHGYRWRPRSAENVVGEIQELVDKYGVTDLSIIDDHFTSDMDRTIEVLDKIISRGLKIKWAAPNGVRVDYLNKDILCKMKESGCDSLVLGIQSGSPKMLKAMNTRLDLDKVEDIVKICQDIDINMAAFFIIGHPGEDRKSFFETIDYAKRLSKYGLKDFRINIARAYPETKLYNYCKENDLFIIKDVENLLVFPGVDLEANIKTEDFDPKELIWRRDYAKRKLMTFENPVYWNLVYSLEKIRLKQALKIILPAKLWQGFKNILYMFFKGKK